MAKKTTASDDRTVTEDELKQVERANKSGKQPAVIGHSFGGLLTQILAGRGLSAASVAIDRHRFAACCRCPCPPCGRPRRCSGTPPTATGPYPSPTSNSTTASPTRSMRGRRVALREVSGARFRRADLPGCRGEPQPLDPQARPLLIISGELDHTVPPAIAKASYKREKRNPGVSEIVEMKGRGHSLTIDGGWQEVADTALTFVKRFV